MLQFYNLNEINQGRQPRYFDDPKEKPFKLSTRGDYGSANRKNNEYIEEFSLSENSKVNSRTNTFAKKMRENKMNIMENSP